MLGVGQEKLQVLGSRFTHFFTSKSLRERLESRVFGPDESAIYLRWFGEESANQAVVVLRDCTIEKGLTGVRVAARTQAVLRNCTIRDFEGPGARIYTPSLPQNPQVQPRAYFQGCTIHDTQHGSVLGWRDEEGRCNYTVRDCEAESFKLIESEAGKEVREAREAMERAREEEARREVEAKARAEKEREEAKRRAEEARAAAARQEQAAQETATRRRAQAADQEAERTRQAEARRRQLAEIRRKRAAVSRSTPAQAAPRPASEDEVPDQPLEKETGAHWKNAKRLVISPPTTRNQRTHRCEWCSDPIDGHYCYNPKKMLFMEYRKGIFCSRQCQKRASWNGFEGTKHTVKNGEVVELDFIE